MLICEEIAQAFNGSLQPQRAKQASNYIVSLRKNENYVISILEILLNNESYPGINLMQFIIQLKVISNIKILNQYQLQKFYKNFIKIIYQVSNRGNHKTLRQVVYNMTLKDYQNWFNFQQFQYYLRNDVDGSKDYKRWMISIVIGIPQACKFKKIQVYSQKYIQKYDNIINLIWPRIYKFEILQIHYILKFLYKCIQCSSLNYSVDLIQRFLNMVLEIGQFFFKKDFFVSDQPSQPSKAAKYLLRLLKNCLIKQVEYIEKTGKKDSSHLQLWAQSNKNVVSLFNAIFSRISKEHPFIGQICQQQIHLESIQLINQYVTAIIPKHIDQNVEKMLYVDIPKMLFNLRSVIECEGISLQNIEDSLNNHSYKLKKSLLILWRTLSCLNLDFSHKQTKLNKNNKSISENSNIAQIQNKLKSPLLHTKFVFQKLSETETFFSPYTRRKKLNNQKIWNFGSNQQWIIVAFDLFRVLAGDIKSRKSFSNTKVSISEILLLYVLPKIVNKNTLIQSHAIAVLVTYQEQFQNLNISQEILTKLSNFLSPDQSKEDQDSTKNTLFCFLPSLKQNWKIKELIRQKIQPIIQYYMQILSKQQENNYYLAKAFSTIIQYYGQSIKEPEKYLNEMVQKIMQVQKTHNITKISLYMESVQKFIQRMKNIDQISSSMLKIFNLSLSMPSYQTDQLLEEEILCCMKTYIKKVTVLSELNIAMFVIYCVYICHHSKQILTKVEQMRGYQKIKKYCEHQNRNIQTYLDESILQIIQYFTVHDKFYEVSKFIGRQPYIFYFDALEACIRVFRQRADPDEQEHMLYFFNEIIKGLIPMVEYIYENTANGPDIIGQIWIFTHSEIFEPYKKQLLNFIDAPSQVAQKLLSHYQQLIKNLAQLWAISTSYFPEAIEQVIESEQKFVFNLIMLIKNCQKSYKQDNFRCTALSGLRQLLSMRVQQNQVEQIINLIAVIVESCLSKKINHNNNLWRWQYSKSDYTIDDQYFVEDKIYNVIKREWDTYQQLEYIDQIIKYIRQMKEDQLQKFQNHLIVLQSYQSKFQGDIWEY